MQVLPLSTTLPLPLRNRSTKNRAPSAPVVTRFTASAAGLRYLVASTVIISVLATPTAVTGDTVRESQQASSERTPLASSEIRQAIEADLDNTESLNAGRIRVSVDNGLVTLSGGVSSLMDKRRASTVVKRTRGVQGVLNQLIVKPTERSDDEIRDDVVTRLRANDSLERREIVVSVSNGEVALAGKLQSLAEKRLAEIAAAGVRGVIAVDNQLTLRPAPDRSDDAMRDEIAGLIANSIYLDDVEIDVKVKDRIAYLRGTVSSAAQKDRLQTVAEIWGIAEVNTDGVDIDPNLADGTVRKRKFADVSDQGIQKALLRAIANDPVVFLAADAISVSVESGKVTLMGTVERLRCKERAERLAMDIVGVIAVDNELAVEPTANPPSDEEIIVLTQAALERSAYLNRREIRVHCHRAHVSLFGLVDSQLEKDLAGWLASGVTGVVHVDNQLAVERKRESKSDQAIERDIERKLKFVLLDQSDDIQVEVTDGVALLSGMVDTWYQWQAAIDLAIEAGAHHPHNLIRVRYHPPHGASRIFAPQ